MNRILLLLLLTSMGPVVCRAQVASQPYPLQLDCSGKDSVLLLEQVKMPLFYPSMEACASYIGQLPATLKKKGFMTASIDSVRIDSTAAYLKVFVGEAWKWGDLDPGNVPSAILEAAGWRGANQQKVYDPGAMSALQQKIVDWMNNNGYPFAAVTLDSLQLNNGVVSARLHWTAAGGTPSIVSAFSGKEKSTTGSYKNTWNCRMAYCTDPRNWNR